MTTELMTLHVRDCEVVSGVLSSIVDVEAVVLIAGIEAVGCKIDLPSHGKLARS